MGSADGSAAQWVDEKCQALSTSELFVQPDMGDSRFAEASSVLQTMIGWSFENSWPDDSQVQDEMRPYLQKVLGLVLPSLVVAALLLLCLLPLWVARCCAHRCCAPSRPSYSSKHKGQACGCCSLWGVAMLVCVVVGLLSSAQTADGVHAQTCTLYSSLAVAAERARALNASVGALASAGGAWNRDAVAPSVGALARLVDAFDESGGVAHLACAEMETASDIASNLGSKVTSANQTFTGQDYPAWAELVQSLNQAAGQSCATLRASVQAPAVQAVSGMLEVTKLVDGAFGPSATGLSTLGRVISPTIAGLVTTQGDLADAMRASWDWWRPDEASSAPLLGWLMFVAPLLLLLLAALGAVCMAVSTHADSRTNRVGLFLSGCAWVGYSLCSVLLLLACTLLLLVLVGLFDFGSVLKESTDPADLIGEMRCAAPWNDEYRAADQLVGATIFFGTAGDGESDGGLNMCAVVADCFREPSVSAQSKVEVAFGVSLSTDKWDAAVADAVSRSGLDAVTTSDLDGASGWGRNASRAVKNITGTNITGTDAFCDGGCTAEVGEIISTDLDAISTGVGRALKGIDETVLLVRGALAAARRVEEGTPTVVGALGALSTRLECSWLKPAYRAPLDPLFGGSGVLGGLAGLAISMGVCGAAGILFLGWLITLQVYSGGVGKQPGCPRPCRCCCPSGKRDYPSRRSSEVEVIESTVVIV